MQNCPLTFTNPGDDTQILLEHFETGKPECIASLVPINKKENQSSYMSQRSQNITNLDSQYNTELSNYLNNYNTYLLNKAMLKNSPPASASQAQLALATDKSKSKFLKSKSKLHEIQKNIETNNKSTNDLISMQGNNIISKTQSIKDKELSIKDQNVLLEEKNKILNSRTRQIELGISKNLYKRNVMWSLIVINVIFVICLGVFIGFSSKKN